MYYCSINCIHYDYHNYNDFMALRDFIAAGADPENFSRGGGPTVSKKKPITHTLFCGLLLFDV